RRRARGHAAGACEADRPGGHPDHREPEPRGARRGGRARVWVYLPTAEDEGRHRQSRASARAGLGTLGRVANPAGKAFSRWMLARTVACVLILFAATSAGP